MSDEITNDQPVFKALRELEFLRGVGDEHVRALAKVGKFVDLPAGIVVFSEGDPAADCYLIVDGSVLLEICGPTGCTQILTVGEGELLGCSPVLGQAQLTASARTLTATRAIELSGHEVLSLCEQNPRFGYEFMRCTALAMAKRLTATRLQLLDLYSAETRTAGGRR